MVFGLPKAHWCYVQWVAAGCALRVTCSYSYACVSACVTDAPLCALRIPIFLFNYKVRINACP